MRCRLACLTPLLVLAGCFAQRVDPDLAFVDEPTRDANLRTYEEMWQHVATTYLNPLPQHPIAPEWQQLPLIDWQATADRFRPRIENAARQGDVHAAMRESVEALGQPHVALLPKSLRVDDGQAAFKTRASDCGLTLALLNNAAVVTRVDPQSPADRVGVRPGWILAAVDNLDVGATVVDLRSVLPRDALSETRILDHIDAALNGGVGKRIHATFRAGDDHAQHKTLVGRAPGDASPRVTGRVLDGDILYFGCAEFLDPASVLNRFTELLTRYPTARGLIIDLRGNPGGVGSIATDLLGHLVDRDKIKIGVILRHDAAVPLFVDHSTPSFAGPVAVLVDRGSLSSSEIFARAIQDLHRGDIFGEPTPGVAVSNIVVTLRDGERFQFAPADYIPIGGGHLETVGVTPDQPVPLDRAALLTGRDNTVDAATRWMEAQRTTPSPRSRGRGPG